MSEPAALDTREIAQSVGRHRLQIEHLPNRTHAAGCRSLHAPGNGRDGVTGGSSKSSWPTEMEALTPDRVAPRPSKGRSDGKRPAPAMAPPAYFPPALRALAPRSKLTALR